MRRASCSAISGSDRDYQRATVASSRSPRSSPGIDHGTAVLSQSGARRWREAGRLSEIITHLAFFAGWANAMDAVAAAKDVFKNRNSEPISFRRLPVPSFRSMRRRKRSGRRASDEQFGKSSPACPVHNGCAVSRSLAEARARAPRPQARHRQRPGRDRPGRADHLPFEPGDG